MVNCARITPTWNAINLYQIFTIPLKHLVACVSAMTAKKRQRSVNDNGRAVYPDVLMISDRIGATENGSSNSLKIRYQPDSDRTS